MTATCSCRKQRAGGDKCGCNGAVPHTLHICRNPKCPCHTATYHMERVHDGAGREYYVPQGARLVRKGKGVQAYRHACGTGRRGTLTRAVLCGCGT